MHYSSANQSNNAFTNAASGACYRAASFSADNSAFACTDMFNAFFGKELTVSDTFGLSVFFAVLFFLSAAVVTDISLSGLVIISVIFNVIINVIIICCRRKTAELEFGTSTH